MNVVGSSSRASLGGGKDAAGAASGGVFLNLYRDIPAVELSLDEFEVYALKRLKVSTGDWRRRRREDGAADGRPNR